MKKGALCVGESRPFPPFPQATTDARAATRLAPSWLRPWLRLVRALDRGGDVAGAAAAGRAGTAATRATPTARAALRDAVDAAAAAGAARGNYGGFDGDVLVVRPAAAGEEWLGGAAPQEEGEEDDDDGDGRPALPCWDAVAASEKVLALAKGEWCGGWGVDGERVGQLPTFSP